MVEIVHALFFILTGIMSSLSILGACFTVVAFSLLPEFRRRGRQLIIYLSIADGMIAFGNLLGLIWIGFEDSLGQPYCIFQAVLSNLASMSSFLWNVCIAVYLYLVLVHNKNRQAESLRLFYHLLCWIMPMVIVGITLGAGEVGEDVKTELPSWCWIRYSDYQLLWQLFCCKVWEMCAYFTIAVIYTLIVISLRSKRKKLTQTLQNGSNPGHHLSTFSMINEANRKLMWVPIVFFLLRIWGTLRFTINAIDRNSPTDWLAPIQGLGDSGQGLANCVLYCFLPGHVRRALWVKCRCLKIGNIGPVQDSSTVVPPGRIQNNQAQHAAEGCP